MEKFISDQKIEKKIQTGCAEINIENPVQAQEINGTCPAVNDFFDFLRNDYSQTLTRYDINEFKRLRQENTKLKQDIIQSLKMQAIGELSSGVAHDFNNILHPIIGSLEMLIEDTHSKRNLQKNLKNILKGANRASELVKQILSFNHPENSDSGPVKIQQIIREILKLSRTSLPDNIKIFRKIDNDCGAVMADPTHIYQIVINLISNAAQAMEKDGGILNVTLKEIEITKGSANEANLNPGTYACLCIADTGAGIDTSIENKIFEPYFTTKKKGTGLGLSVISGIVKKYCGQICFSSKPGKGSRFKVFIPKWIGSPDTTALTDREGKKQYGHESILFVDDDEFIVDIQQQSFERHGYRVKAFVNCFDALNEFRNRPGFFDIVICDMTMPYMSGLTLANKIKEIDPGMPVIICTGFSEKINKDNYHDKGIDGFLLKPVKKNECLELMRNLLDNRQTGFWHKTNLLDLYQS